MSAPSTVHDASASAGAPLFVPLKQGEYADFVARRDEFTRLTAELEYAKVQQTARYRKQFRFKETVEQSYRKFVAQQEFATELDRQIARALATSGGRRR